jgi:RimJ/RimL family protein N-acetyltransferase
LELRGLGADDYPDVVEVYRQSPRFLVELNGRPADNVGLEMVQEDAAQAANHGAQFVGFFLRSSGALIGVADYVPGGYRSRPSLAWIALLMIAELHQRQGYGTEAYQLVEDEILANPDVQTIGLGVLINNGPAIAFWQRMGYRRSGSTVQDKDGREILMLEKHRPGAGEDDGGE